MSKAIRSKIKVAGKARRQSFKSRQWVSLVLALIVGSSITAFTFYFFIPARKHTSIYMAPFQTNIVKAASANEDYRRVLFTGANTQLVLMSIPSGSDVGQETHKHVEQTLYFQSGTGEAILNGKTTPIGPGDVVIVTPGTQHNFLNTGNVPLKIITTYSPPNHIDGTIELTKADATANTADEAFGEAQ